MDKANRIPTEKEFVCKMCGRKFKSYANHASYCTYCRDIRSRERAKRHREKQLENDTRRIGSEQLCPECGKTYILKSGSQKVCEDCRKKHNNKIQSVASDKYKKKAYDTCTFYVKKGRKQELQELAKKYKLSLNELCNTAIEEYVKRLEKTKDES